MRRLIVVRDTTVARLTDRKLSTQLKSYRLAFHTFSRESSEIEVLNLSRIAKNSKAELIIGVGGGKCLDTSKLAAWKLGLPLITVPTSAATCSAWTGVAPVYGEDGGYRHTIEGPSPHGLILDNELTATAPPRFLASGMVDALAKYYEPRDNMTSVPTGIGQTALQLGEGIYETISRYGPLAYRAAGKGRNSEALNCVAHTSIVQTGLVGELGGKVFRHGLAHSLYGAWTFLGLTRRYLHGELVGLGLLIELNLAGKRREHRMLHAWMKSWNMPTALPDFARYQNSKSELKALCVHMAKFSQMVPLTKAFLKDPLKAMKIVSSK